MTKSTALALLMLCLVALVALTGCISAATDELRTTSASTLTPTGTLEPTYQTATAVVAATGTADARAAIALQAAIAQITLDASTAIAAEATAQSARQTEQAFQVTQAAVSTATARSDQATAMAVSERQTATAVVQGATATRSAFDLSVSQTAQAFTATAMHVSAAGTATMEVSNASVSGTSTQSAINIVIAEQTAVVDRIQLQAETERQTAHFKAWAWIIGAIILALFFAWLIYKFWPVFLTQLGVVRWGPDGKPYFTFRTDDGGFAVVDMSRNTGPVVKLEPTGPVLSPIQAEDSVLARAQAGELLLASQSGKGDPAQPINRQAMTRQALKAGQPAPNKGFRLLPLQEKAALPDPNTQEILDAEWREANHVD